MFSKLVMHLACESKLNFNMSSLMQGALMESISEEYAAYLHMDGINPYTQRLKFEKDDVMWIITTIGTRAHDEIISRFLNENLSKVHLKNKDMTIKILSKEEQSISYDELMDETYFSQCDRYVKLRFETPTSFKVNGKYQFYPTVYHIFFSLINKHDSLIKGTEFYSEEVMEQIVDNVDIVRYKLKSTLFYLEGTKIPAFMGEVTLRIRGPQQFVNLINMLAKFGVFSGVGIKASIGMGAISICDN